MRDTSINAFRDLPQIKINRQEKKILRYVMSRIDTTRHEIARALKMETSTVSARVNNMLEWGVLDECEYNRKCRVSGRTVHVVNA